MHYYINHPRGYKPRAGSHEELRGRSQGRGRIAQSARGSNTAPGIRAGERARLLQAPP